MEESLPVNPAVLFVDDEAGILSSLRRLTLDEDFRILTASSGEEGLRRLREEAEVGVIVSDQRMPGMNGAEFLARSREIAPEALRIVLTGYADIHAAVAAINEGGACRYISKPWDDQELVQILRDAVRTYALQQENRRLNAIIQRQNEELKDWNERLKSRVLQQTAEIRRRNEDLHAANSRLKRNFQTTLEAFSSLIELQAKELRNHTRNVARLSLEIARQLDFTAEQLEELQIAALLHDIGEIGNPPRIAGKDIYSLEKDDLELYMQHAVRGQAAIDRIEDLRGAGLLIRHHHERFDGGGFPDGAAGAQIPLGSRIIALADFIDRRIAERQREGADNLIDLVREEVRSRSGTWFDPALVDLAVQPLREAYAEMQPQSGLVERVLPATRLEEGMLLVEDLYSGTGLLLLHKGARLEEKNIAAILRYHELDPFPEGIRVLTTG